MYVLGAILGSLNDETNYASHFGLKHARFHVFLPSPVAFLLRSFSTDVCYACALKFDCPPEAGFLTGNPATNNQHQAK